MGCKFEQSKGDNQPKLYTEMHSLADRRLGKRARQRAQNEAAREQLDDEDPVMMAIRSEIAPTKQQTTEIQSPHEDTSLSPDNADDRQTTIKMSRKWAKDESGQWRNPDGQRGTESQVPFTSDPGRRLSSEASRDAIVGAPPLPPHRPSPLPQSKESVRHETAINQSSRKYK